MKDILFRDILPRVSKPARYSGGEYNMIAKDWDGAGARMVFAFPDVYEIGMSHLGGRILYSVVNEHSRHLMERSFAPWPDMEACLRERGLPLYALESFRPVKDFEVVGFSLQYELSISNVLNMLDLSGITVLAARRGEDEPLVVAGGPVAFNPEPFVDFFDAFMIGDGEEQILQFLDCVEACRGRGREETLLALAQLEGVYVPSFYCAEYNPDGTLKSFAPTRAEAPARVRRALLRDLDGAHYPLRPIVPYLEITHDRAVLEVMRGCYRGCRFCHAGMVYRPVRRRGLDTLRAQAAAQLAGSGYEEISLSSLSALDHPHIEELIKGLVCDYAAQGIGVSLPSSRVDALNVELANQVQKVRKTTLTLAPEAGSQWLRNVINKNLDTEQIHQAAEAAFSSGWSSLKLYFMFGLPYETEADLEGMVQLLEELRDIGRRHSRRPVELKASVAGFVPKAHTPFQWEAQNSREQLEAKKKIVLSRRLKSVKISFHDSPTSVLEGVIARGDRRLGAAIYRAWQKGCKFDGWSEYFNFGRWQEAMAECGLDPAFYNERQRGENELFPWDFVDSGINKEFLWREKQRAAAGQVSPDCREHCMACGMKQCFGESVCAKEGLADEAAR
ncbi:MAG: TIGR03960 family B12-binding radical SAM protein [Syntrophomonadaceae bacterium]|nr:TIGR03960 family B12-binding radical SAM protein [Syntrophomonadaceae bacterium]